MRNWLPTGSEARHELPQIQWSHSKLNAIKNNTENYALFKKTPLRSVILKWFPLASIYFKTHKNFPKIQEPPHNFRHQKGDMKQDPCCRPTTLQWPVNLTVICHRMLVTCELIQILYMGRGGGTSIIMLKILGTTAQNFITWATRHAEFVQPCCMTTCVTHITYTVQENRLTVSAQCSQHTAQAHTNQLLYVPSGTHRTDTVPNDEARQLLPYLKFHLRTINHIIRNTTVLSVPPIQLGNKK